MSDLVFYIKKEDLTALVRLYESQKPPEVGNKPLRGFVFRQGKDAQQKDALFPDALYSDQEIPTGDPDQDILVINEREAPGCPYPPGY